MGHHSIFSSPARRGDREAGDTPENYQVDFCKIWSSSQSERNPGSGLMVGRDYLGSGINRISLNRVIKAATMISDMFDIYDLTSGQLLNKLCDVWGSQVTTQFTVRRVCCFDRCRVGDYRL